MFCIGQRHFVAIYNAWMDSWTALLAWYFELCCSRFSPVLVLVYLCACMC